MSADPIRSQRLELRVGDRRASISIALAERDVRRLRDRIDQLRGYREAALPPPPDLAAWLERCGDGLHAALAQVGLVDPRVPKPIALEFFRRCVERDAAVPLRRSGRPLSPRTMRVERQVYAGLAKFMGSRGAETMRMHAAAPVLEEYLDHYARSHADGSVRLVARVLHRWSLVAVKAGIWAASPVADRPRASVSSQSVGVVSQDVFARVLKEAMPARRSIRREIDAEGRSRVVIGEVVGPASGSDGLPTGSLSAARSLAVVGLAGLRMPSEVLGEPPHSHGLTWQDIVWVDAAGQPLGAVASLVAPPAAVCAAMRVYATKTGRERWVPVDHDLLTVLYGASPAARGPLENLAMRVVPLKPGPTSSRRVTREVDAALRRAGLEPWPRKWDTLRETAATRWRLKGVPEEMRAVWMGHSRAVHERHYTRIGAMDVVAGLHMLGVAKSVAKSVGNLVGECGAPGVQKTIVVREGVHP